MKIFDVDLAALNLPPELQTPYVHGNYGGMCRASACSYHGTFNTLFNVETSDGKMDPAVEKRVKALGGGFSVKLVKEKTGNYYETASQGNTDDVLAISESLRVVASAAVEVSSMQQLKQIEK